MIAAPACEAVSEVARRIERGELEAGVDHLALLNELAGSAPS